MPTIMQSLEDIKREILSIKAEVAGIKEELKVSNKESKKSSFNSNYLAILFSLLGIALPVFLFKQELQNSGILSTAILIAIYLYVPFIIISLLLSIGKSKHNKEPSLMIFAGAGIFISLLIFSIILDATFHFISNFQPYFTPVFFIIY